MFSNLRSTAILVFGIIVIITLFFAFYFKSSMVASVIANGVEEKALVVSKAYNNSIWNKYAPVIDYIYSISESERDSITQFTLFTKESAAFYKIDNLVKVIVYSDGGDVLFDSKHTTSIMAGNGFLDSIFLGNTDVGVALDEAAKGKMSLAILTGASVNNSGVEKSESIIKVFVPIKSQFSKNGNKSTVKGTVELNFIVTESIGFLWKIQFSIIFAVLLIASSILVVIFYSSKKAEEIMEKQQEASVEMAAAKAMAESESRAKSQFLANVSHELRTPLNAIIGFSEIINNESMGPIGNDEYKEFVQDIHTSGVHLLSLINDILDFSKAEENKLSVDFEQIDITKLVKICMRMVLPRAENAKVNLKDEIPQEHFVLMADQKRLKQVILNLLSNAVKFTTEGGEVMIRVWRDVATNSIVIEVKDTGVGMAPQDLARALSPFGQVDNKLSRRYEGTGLGLPLTKTLVELMRGRFDIRSEVGLGTTVLLYFPLQDSDMQEIGEGEDALEAAAASAVETQPVVEEKPVEEESPQPVEEAPSSPEPVEEAKAAPEVVPEPTEEVQTLISETPPTEPAIPAPAEGDTVEQSLDVASTEPIAVVPEQVPQQEEALTTEQATVAPDAEEPKN